MDSLILFRRDDDDSQPPVCQNTNDYDGRSNLRILSIFIILISSGIGSFIPILTSRYSFIKLPDWCFFIAKFAGSGVIIATAFIHLLEPASDALSNECLGGVLAEYPWAFGICLMSLFLLFLIEIITHFFIMRAIEDGGNHDESSLVSKDSHFADDMDLDLKSNNDEALIVNCNSVESNNHIDEKMKTPVPSMPGVNHYSHEADHQDLAQIGTPTEDPEREKYLNQLLAVAILEFGIIFHSVFIGLSLAVAGEEFITLFNVLVFHQMLEGLGLGTRIAETNWPKNRRLTPWIMALGFTVTTPIAIAIGLGVRHSFVPGSRKALISNGVFDAISAGILLYTGIVELMAHEFLYSNQFKGEGGFKRMILAYLIMATGAGVMALIGKWA